MHPVTTPHPQAQASGTAEVKMGKSSSLATAARRRLQQQRQQRQDEGQEPSREPHPSSGMLSGDRLGVLIVREGSNVEDIREAYAGIQSVLGTLSSTAQRPAWLHGLNDVMAALPALALWEKTCTEAGERARVGVLLRFVAEGRRVVDAAEGQGPEWRPTLDALDAHVRKLVGALKQWREVGVQLAELSGAALEERAQGLEAGGDVPPLKSYASSAGLSQDEKMAALSQSLAFLMELSRDSDAVRWYADTIPRADDGRPTLADLGVISELAQRRGPAFHGFFSVARAVFDAAEELEEEADGGAEGRSLAVLAVMARLPPAVQALIGEARFFVLHTGQEQDGSRRWMTPVVPAMAAARRVAMRWSRGDGGGGGEFVEAIRRTVLVSPFLPGGVVHLKHTLFDYSNLAESLNELEARVNFSGHSVEATGEARAVLRAVRACLASACVLNQVESSSNDELARLALRLGLVHRLLYPPSHQSWIIAPRLIKLLYNPRSARRGFLEAIDCLRRLVADHQARPPRDQVDEWVRESLLWLLTCIGSGGTGLMGHAETIAKAHAGDEAEEEGLEAPDDADPNKLLAEADKYFLDVAAMRAPFESAKVEKGAAAPWRARVRATLEGVEGAGEAVERLQRLFSEDEAVVRCAELGVGGLMFGLAHVVGIGRDAAVVWSMETRRELLKALTDSLLQVEPLAALCLSRMGRTWLGVEEGGAAQQQVGADGDGGEAGATTAAAARARRNQRRRAKEKKARERRQQAAAAASVADGEAAAEQEAADDGAEEEEEMEALAAAVSAGVTVGPSSQDGQEEEEAGDDDEEVEEEDEWLGLGSAAALADYLGEGAPDDFFCPIGLTLMRDPVFCLDGVTCTYVENVCMSRACAVSTSLGVSVCRLVSHDPSIHKHTMQTTAPTSRRTSTSARAVRAVCCLCM